MSHQGTIAPPGGTAEAAIFTDADFAAIARHAYDDFGLHLPAGKRDLVYSRLIKRLRALNLPDFKSYCALLDTNRSGERMQMLSALTTNVTHFFRENHHFQTLRETVLPPLIKSARSGGRVRIWSAGCSAGQEPYSLAMTVLDLCPEAARLDLRILASDVDPEILAKATEGIYPMDEQSEIHETLRARFTAPAAQSRPSFAITEAPRELISFRQLNLMDDWPMRGRFDVIFCRNVAIYFDRPTQQRLWMRFAGLLAEDGYLFIGHSEHVSGAASDLLETAGVTSYHRIGRASDRDLRPNEERG